MKLGIKEKRLIIIVVVLFSIALTAIFFNRLVRQKCHQSKNLERLDL